MEKTTIKEFWNKHKTIIIIGAISAATGGIIGGVIARHPHGEAQEFINTLRQFNWHSNTGRTVFGDLLMAQSGSNHAEVFSANPDYVHIGNLGELMKDHYVSEGLDLNTKVTGVALFLKK